MKRSFLAAAVLASVLSVVVCTPVWGVSPRVAVCTPAKQAPVINGKLDDACWKTAGVVTDFLLDSGKGIARDETEARLCFDAKSLYIGITCHESDMKRVKATKVEPDTDISSDDDIEIFFDANEDRRTFHHFMFNTLGTKTEMLNGGAAWDCNWTVAIETGRDRWTAEVAIPLKVLGAAKPGATWGFNIGRGQAGARAYASFAGIKGKWASPGGFATLKFAAKAGDEGRLFKARKGVRVFALHPQKPLDLLNLPNAKEEYLAAFGTPGEVVPYTFHVVNLERKKSVTAKISATPFAGRGGKIDVPESALLYLYPKMAGSYAWEFLGEGDTTTIAPGQRGGFWLDLRIPDDAKSGDYKSTVTVTVDGTAKTRVVKLLVLPFKLDANPTSCGFHTPKDRNGRMLLESMQLMREHGMTTFAPYGGWGGPRGVAEYVRLREQFGFKGKTIYADGCMYVGDRLARWMKLPRKGPLPKPGARAFVANDAFRKRYVADMKKYYDEAVRLGVPEMSFSIGDELTNDGYHAALHSIERAKILREGIPKMVLTTDTNGYTEAVGCSRYLNAVGVNDGWDGPDNHNGGRKILTEATMKEIRANRCAVEFVNTGTDRFPFGLYLWRMTNWGIQSKIEWIWSSDRMSPAWLNVYREHVKAGRPTGERINRQHPPDDWKTFVTVALKFSRMGTVDARYAATLQNLVKRIPEPKAKQFLADVTKHIPVELAESRRAGWDADRCDAVRWELAKHIMRLRGKSVGLPRGRRDNLSELAVDSSTKWSTAKLEKKFIRHKSRTFSCAKVAKAPKLDGVPVEKVWQQAEVITGAYDDSDISLIPFGFQVRTLHTDAGVYLSVISDEPKPEKIATSTKGNDNPGIWRVDDIEIFIDPGKTGEYYHLVYDAKGTKSDYKKTEISWNGKWQVACHFRRDGDVWTSEVFLPFATFGGKDKPWGIFVGRGSPTRGQYFGIMPIKGSWHSVKQFGTLVFRPMKPHIFFVNFERLQVGANRVQLNVSPDGQLKFPRAMGCEMVLPGGARKSLGVPGGSGPGMRFAGAFELQHPGEQEIALRVTDGQGAILDTETFIVRVPELLSVTLDQRSLFTDDLMRSASVALNVPKKELPNLALEFEIAAPGIRRKVSLSKLEGNRLDLALNLPNLNEGKYRLHTRLKAKHRVLARNETDFFVTRNPSYAR